MILTHQFFNRRFCLRILPTIFNWRDRDLMHRLFLEYPWKMVCSIHTRMGWREKSAAKRDIWRQKPMVSCRCSSNPWNSTTQPMSTPKIADVPSRNHHFPQSNPKFHFPQSIDLHLPVNVSSFATFTVVTPLGTVTLGSKGGACH